MKNFWAKICGESTQSMEGPTEWFDVRQRDNAYIDAAGRRNYWLGSRGVLHRVLSKDHLLGRIRCARKKTAAMWHLKTCVAGWEHWHLLYIIEYQHAPSPLVILPWIIGRRYYELQHTRKWYGDCVPT